MATTAFRQPTPPKRILVAEDDLLVAQTIRMALAVDGHQVSIAEDGEQALAMFSAGEFDLVIADFRLPKVDGLELAQAIKAQFPALPIVLITAYAESIERRMGKVSNIDLMLEKPFSVEDLLGALRKIFPET